ncbi:MAG: hypothetical protein EZS28_003515 [Streblomastix strix]|uniref:Uncharacterized protein n=1 Tax=Streblomastix strix TaxID=222440 RepID=A0A5J4X2J3_9EUKA|nr:MAG: hypothetical protein EZS28_003515 [Streblomastix strix]
MKQKVLDQALTILELPAWLDILASRTNKRLQSNCSFLQDNLGFTLNGYSFNWGQNDPYLYPPIIQKFKILLKVREDNAEEILIIPNWKGQVQSRWIQAMKMAEVDLGEVNDCLEMGQVMKYLHQQLAPGRMKAIRLASMRYENTYQEKLVNALDLMMKL